MCCSLSLRRGFEAVGIRGSLSFRFGVGDGGHGVDGY